jgi:hypothetical protein
MECVFYRDRHGLRGFTAEIAKVAETLFTLAVTMPMY